MKKFQKPSFINYVIYILIVYVILISFYIGGAFYFINTHRDFPESKIVVSIIISVSSISLIVMLGLIYIKFQKLPMSEIKRFLVRLNRHEQLLLGKKVKEMPKYILNFKIFLFYFLITQNLFSVVSVIILLFSTANLQSNYWFIYILLIWNLISVLIALIKIIIFSPLKLKAKSSYFEIIYTQRKILLPNEKITWKTCDQVYGRIFKFNYTDAVENSKELDNNFIDNELMEIRDEKHWTN
ncbi:hypothetical protein EI74_0090 [Mycoplasma testudineum]|uniref:Uncharacterized protein n=1 Tax=Mycoplasma testudineum TaxID=244584 RepID=A0A4R6IFE7_9MOLU|nr:hypothetical protein [Mycoplasma testudineum]OYD27172.1 hypothetical protein CG473_00835 [Mycoplasma testudineum]TDO21070.1 hypothetical protein EI74_0090 [Mycoplasma testudineum]